MKLSQIYTRAFFEHVHKTARPSAMAMVPIILGLIQPKSVIDVGCGTGEWLLAFQEYGVEDIFGVDGEYLDRSLLTFSQENFKALDLSKPFVLDRTYDLALCLEVAEHLAPECALDFIESLARLAPIVIFSAAIPFQGGIHHINEQWPEYWVEIFASKGFVPVDVLRKKIWDNDQIGVWYRQNVILFCTEQIVLSNSALGEAFRATNPKNLAMVHPEIYLYRATMDSERIMQLEHRSLFEYIKQIFHNILDKDIRNAKSGS